MRSWDDIRNDFPLLQARDVIYLDSTASSQKPQVVLDALQEFYVQHNANVNRGAYTLSIEATEAYERAREQLAKLISAPRPEQLIFTRNTTEAINLVAYGWGMKHLNAGDQILVTEMEHHSNIVPWHLVAGYRQAEVLGVRILPDGQLDREDYSQKLRNGKVRMVALSHISNALGTVNPVAELIAEAHQHGALVLIDGAQSIAHMPVNVQQLDADFFAFSGHKMCGPTGIGGLYGKAALLRNMNPFLGGGDMIHTVHISHSTYADIPHKFEAGTPAIAEAVALGVAAEYLQSIGLERISAYEHDLTSYALQQFRQLEGVQHYGVQDLMQRAGVLSFNIEGIHAHDVASMLDTRKICVRAGHHCAQPLMRALGLASTARASFYFYNNTQEIDLFIQAVRETRDFFASFS